MCSHMIAVLFYSYGGVVVVFFKQRTAYEMRISDWSSDMCSSDLRLGEAAQRSARRHRPDEDAGIERHRLHADAIAEERASGERRRRIDRDHADGVTRDRKSVGEGKSVSVRVDLGGRRIINKRRTTH